MPWSITEQENNYCVVNDGTGETVACHSERQDALDNLQALYANYETSKPEDQKRIYFGGAVKALGSGLVEGYLIKFTDKTQKDLQGEYFDQNTDLQLKDFPIMGERTFYHHALDETLGTRVIGRIIKAKIDDAGAWVQAQLDMRDEYDKMIYELAESGKLGWSSGALPQSVKVGEDGHIDSWAVIEGSLTPTPAMPLETKIYTVKALAEMHREAITPKGVKDSTSADSRSNPDKRQINPTNVSTNITTSKGTLKMDEMTPPAEGDKTQNAMAALSAKIDELIELLGERNPMGDEEKAVAKEAVEDEATKQEMVDEEDVAKTLRRFTNALPQMIDTALTAVTKKRAASKAAFDAAYEKSAAAQPGQSKATGLGRMGTSDGTSNNGRIEMGDNLRYAHMDADDMALGIKLMLAAAGPMASVKGLRDAGILSDDYLKNFAQKAFKFAQSEPYNTKTRDGRLANAAIKSVLPIKANELDASDIATQGQEWVGEFWETTLWRRERFALIYDRVVSAGMMVKEIPKGADTAHFPTEGNDPIAYTVPQANDVDSTGRPQVTGTITPFNTGEVTVTPSEVKLMTTYTVILDEDAVIALAPQVNFQVNRKMEETRDQLMLNGDTATGASVNINLIDGTPAALSTMTAPYYLATNGFRKLALVTAPAASITSALDAGGTLALSNYLSTLRLLDGELRQYKDRMLFIIDPDTEATTLGLPEIATDDVRRTFATITSGVINNVYGINVVPTGFLPLANTAGMVAGTNPTTVNVKGSILLVYAPYWAFAYKRQIILETGRDIMSGTNVYVATMRLGMVARGNNAAVQTYNVGVA